MKTWGHIINQLAHASATERAERDAYDLIKAEYEQARTHFDHCEKNIQSLESVYQQAKQHNTELDKQAANIENSAETEFDASENNTYTTQKLTSDIADLQTNVTANRKEVAKLEQDILALKGALSQNRFNLFRLEQQMDTLNATSQLHKAKHHISSKHGIRTGFEAFCQLAAQSASNDPGS